MLTMNVPAYSPTNRSQSVMNSISRGSSNKPSCNQCKERAFEWCQLSAESLSHLDENKLARKYTAGQNIYYQGTLSQGIYCIKSGMIALRKLDSYGNETIVRISYTGHTLGYRSFFAQETYDNTAQALTDVEICFISKEIIETALEKNPSLAMAFLKHLASDLREADEARMMLTTMPVRTRLVQLLLTLKDSCGEMEETGNLIIQLPLSRQDMALMISTRPETLSRTIRALEQDGIVEFHRDHVIVFDLDDLFDEIEEQLAA